MVVIRGLLYPFIFKIVAIGVVPYLLPGVGLPAEKRSKFLQHLLGTEKEKDILEVSLLHWHQLIIQEKSYYNFASS
jgi:hypothetical protein